MRSRRPPSDPRVHEVARRRLAALAAEAGTRSAAAPASEALGVVSDPVAPGSPTTRPAPAANGGRHARRPLSSPRRAAGWLSDRLPAALQDRAHLGSAQFGVLVLVVAAGLLLSAWWLFRTGGAGGEVVPPRPVTAPVVSADPSTGAGPSPATAPAATSPGLAPTPVEAAAEIVVDVVGKVRRPGIVVLPAGSRVVDAVEAAGGLRRGVDLRTVNMARPLTDGEQVVVGVPLPGGVAAGALSSPGVAGPDALVNLNTADQTALETLPGIGPVTAAAILQWRAEHGGFTAIDELLEVDGIGPATLEEIAPHVTL